MWLPAASNTTETLTGIDTDGRGEWIACGDTGENGIVIYSSDGRNWNNETTLPAYFFLTIACGR